MKNRSVKLPMLTKNSKHLRETSAHNSSPLIEFYFLVKNKVVKLPFVTIKKHISLHLHTRTKQLSLLVKTVSNLNSLVSFKVHLTPNIFFTEIIRFILWSNVAQKFFKSVKYSNFYAPSKCVKVPPFWFATELNGARVEGRM